MRKQYMAWLEDPDAIQVSREMTLTIRDLTPGKHKYRATNVRGIVSRAENPGEDILWVRYDNGRLIPQPWSIKIVEELPEFFPGRPYSGVVD